MTKKQQTGMMEVEHATKNYQNHDYNSNLNKITHERSSIGHSEVLKQLTSNNTMITEWIIIPEVLLIVWHL